MAGAKSAHEGADQQKHKGVGKIRKKNYQRKWKCLQALIRRTKKVINRSKRRMTDENRKQRCEMA